jgi:GMP synthase (glutamine-hydrolysing)
MKPILVIKTGHAVQKAFEQAGDFERWIIKSMQADAVEFSVVSVYQGEKLPAYDDIAGVVITGSPAMVTDRLDWSEYTADWLRHAMVARLPMLGICYGHQLLAHAFGGKVDYHPQGREIGTVAVDLLEEARQDPLFSRLDRHFSANVSHMQSVSQLPAGANVLGRNDFEAYHVVRFAENVWGCQFHPEFNALVMRAYVEERQDALHEEGLDVQKILAGIQETPVASRLMLEFYRMIRAQDV